MSASGSGGCLPLGPGGAHPLGRHPQTDNPPGQTLPQADTPIEMTIEEGRMHSNVYRPKQSFGQGNVFTPVCHSVNRVGGVPDQAPPGPGRYTPPDQAGTPPGPGNSPQDQAGTPPDQVHPPGPGRYPPRPGTPPDQVPPQTRYPLPDQADTPTPRTRQVPPPPGPGTPPQEQAGIPPDQVHPPPSEAADPGIRSTIGRYASYWNAFLFNLFSSQRV